MPFGGYEDFASCVAANQDKDDPQAYCATIMRAIEGDDGVKKAETVRGYESPEPGDLPEGKAKKLAEVYASCREDDPGRSKEKCSRIGWGAVKKMSFKDIVSDELHKALSEDGKWDESKHPRDKGQFTSGQGKPGGEGGEEEEQEEPLEHPFFGANTPQELVDMATSNKDWDARDLDFSEDDDEFIDELYKITKGKGGDMAIINEVARKEIDDRYIESRHAESVEQEMGGMEVEEEDEDEGMVKKMDFKTIVCSELHKALMKDEKWDEKKHPRDKGKFTSGQGKPGGGDEDDEDEEQEESPTGKPGGSFSDIEEEEAEEQAEYESSLTPKEKAEEKAYLDRDEEEDIDPDYGKYEDPGQKEPDGGQARLNDTYRQEEEESNKIFQEYQDVTAGARGKRDQAVKEAEDSGDDAARSAAINEYDAAVKPHREKYISDTKKVEARHEKTRDEITGSDSREAAVRRAGRSASAGNVASQTGPKKSPKVNPVDEATKEMIPYSDPNVRIGSLRNVPRRRAKKSDIVRHELYKALSALPDERLDEVLR